MASFTLSVHSRSTRMQAYLATQGPVRINRLKWKKEGTLYPAPLSYAAVSRPHQRSSYSELIQNSKGVGRRTRPKTEESAGLRGLGHNDLRPFGRENLLIKTPTQCSSETGESAGLQPSASVSPRTLPSQNCIVLEFLTPKFSRPNGRRSLCPRPLSPADSSVLGQVRTPKHPSSFESALSTTISGRV